MHRYFRCFIHEVFRGSDLFVNTSCDLVKKNNLKLALKFLYFELCCTVQATYVRANVAKQLFKVANSVLALVRVDNCRVFVIQL
jgi:hypothetical protein